MPDEPELSPKQIALLRSIDPDTPLTRTWLLEVVARSGQVEMRELLDALADS